MDLKKDSWVDGWGGCGPMVGEVRVEFADGAVELVLVLFAALLSAPFWTTEASLFSSVEDEAVSLFDGTAVVVFAASVSTFRLSDVLLGAEPSYPITFCSNAVWSVISCLDPVEKSEDSFDVGKGDVRGK